MAADTRTGSDGAAVSKQMCECVTKRRPDRYVVIVTGSREWTDRAVIRAHLADFPPGTLVLHGGALGADAIADSEARGLGLDVRVEPYFSDLGRAGGPARNA